MSSEASWQKLTLKNAGVSLIDCDHRTPPAADTGYPYIAIPQIKNGHIELDGVRKISPEHYAEWTRKLKPQANDVIVVRRCNSGDSAWVPRGLECAIGQNLVVLRSDGKRVMPEFLRWLVSGPDWWEQVRKFINVGAVFDSLKCREIPHFELTIPPIEAQQEITTLLGALDDRITLLRETNATLEAIAQAMFKSWFVDFDPVHANATLPSPRGRGAGGEGNNASRHPHPSPLPAGEGVQSMSVATAALFPDSFEESELGLIPKGWKVGTLGDIAKTVKKQLQPSALHSELHYVGLEHIPRKSLSLSDWGDAEGLGSAKAAFAKDDILFGKLRPYFHKVVIAPFDGVCSTDILVCQSIKPPYYGLAAMHLFSKTLIDYAERLSNGAKMPRVNWKDLAAYPICVPPEALAANYSEIIKPLISRMIANVHQAQTLATLRDTLLPRLISGQLRIENIEGVV